MGLDMLTGGKSPADLVADASLLPSLDSSSKGLLRRLFSQRSASMTAQSDFPSALEDASLSISCKADDSAGHLALLKALEASKAPLPERREAAQRARLGCPLDEEIKAWEIKMALERGAPAAVTDSGHVDEKELMKETMKIASLVGDPRRGVACGDVGSAYAKGAFGLPRDEKKATVYRMVMPEHVAALYDEYTRLK